MEEIVYSLNLDLRKNTHQVLVMKEGDVNSRVIEAVITDNGKPYDLTNCAVNLKWKKPDGHVVYSEINTVNDNTVTVVCTEQMLVAGGLAEAEFEIIDKTSEKVISTLKFSISINKTVSDNFEIESSDDFSALRTQYGVMKGHVEDTSIHLPTDGSSGQILKLDEDNNASWQDVFSLTKDEYEKLSNIEDNAEVNQNAFSNVKVGTTTISADSKTDTLTLVAGDNVTITPDANGDKITISSSDTDSKVEQRKETSSVDRRILLSANANDEKETDFVVKSANFTANPSTGAFYAKGFDRINISNQTLDINTLTLSSGSPMVMRYIEKTNGGAANITNIPVTNSPFILDVELIRWASATDYITKQTFVSATAQANEYVRYCTSGTWSSWTKRVFTDTNTDTKNTAGSTNSSSKLFLIGATSQSANPQTYSHDTVYIGTNGHLYSNSKQVVNLSDSQALTNKTYNGYTLAAACAKAVTDSSSASAIGTGTSLVTERDVYYGLPKINGVHTYNSSTSIYAPTSVGTSGYLLMANDSGVPTWFSKTDTGLVVASLYKTEIIREGNAIILRGNGTDSYGKGGLKIAVYSSADGTIASTYGEITGTADNTCNLGQYHTRWQNVYAASGTINTSDRNLKNDIQPLIDKYKQLFMLLLPVSFTFKDGNSGRTHIGFISQDVEEAMVKVGLTSLDFAGFCKDTMTEEIINDKNETERVQIYDENGEAVYRYSLRYEEFIALNTAMIQDLISEVDTLKEDIKDLKEKVNNLIG